jgi:REP element-mobilizing transposase RayT
LRGYDYRCQGAYFITVCTHERGIVLGDIEDGAVRLNTFGRVVAWSWMDLERHHSVVLDDWIVMPDHMHGIIALPTQRSGIAANGATQCGPPQGSIGSIVGSFKSAAARRINAQRETRGRPLWQRGYYEHIIRNGPELERVRQYIHDNPRRWQHNA